ncbi:MAG: 30S ribosomal protein S18 [Deltaproteobacteria bacterium]|nr:30S ribosomal protein S18 [Deltaproteobacteria bacterium]
MAFAKKGGGGRRRKKVCRFCVNAEIPLSYKQPLVLNQFLTERGKIVPRRISGNCAHHQRLLAVEIKRARNMALLPFTRNLPV